MEESKLADEKNAAEKNGTEKNGSAIRTASIGTLEAINGEIIDLEKLTCTSRLWSILKTFKVEPVMFGMFLAISLSDSVITNLALARTCEVKLQYNSSTCSLLKVETEEGRRVETLVQPGATYVIMGKTLMQSVLPAIFSLYFGPWSDHNGRKPLMLAPLIGHFLTFILYTILSVIPNLQPEYLLLATIPLALSGGTINAVASAHCYVSDITKEEDRPTRLGLIGGALFIGLMTGVIFSPYVYNMSEKWGFVIVFSSSASIVFLTFIYTYFFVPETVTKKEGSKGFKGLFEKKLLVEMFQTCFKKRENNGRAVIVLSIFALTCCIVTIEGEHNLKYLFTRVQFRWNLSDFNRYTAVHVTVLIIGAVIGLFGLVKYWKINDIVLGIIAFSMRTAEDVYYVFIPSSADWLMYLAGFVGFFAGISVPILRAILSKAVPKEELAKVFSLTFSFESLVPILTNPAYFLVYNNTVKRPATFFLLSGVLNAICVVWFVYVYGLFRQSSKLPKEERNKDAKIA